MQKVVILALHLGYGGIEKSIATLANLLATNSNLEVEIISIYRLYENPVFDLAENVKVTYLIEDDIAERVKEYKTLFFHFHWIRLFQRLYQDYFSQLHFLSFFKDAFGGLFMYYKRSALMKKAIKMSNADVIISTRVLLNDLSYRYSKEGVLKIGWEHRHYHNNMKYAMDVVRSAKNLDYLVLVSHELQQFYKKELMNSKVQCIYIPNTLQHIPKTLSSVSQKRLISVGRLSSEKGYFDLLKIYAMLVKKYPDWQLDIVGDGPERKKLEKFIQMNHLSKHVILHGYQNSNYIDKLMHNSSIYLMTSYTESFGIVLLEAMSHGLPCLAFDSAEGAREIITSGRDGYLIRNRNFSLMVKKIEDLIEDKERRKELGKAGRKKINEYKPENILEKWLLLIQEEEK